MKNGFWGRWALSAGTVFLICLIAANTAIARDDWQYWGLYVVNHSITEHNDLSLIYAVYAKDSMSDDYAYQFMPAYKRIVNRRLSFLGGGFFSTSQIDKRTWNDIRSFYFGPLYTIFKNPVWKIDSQVRCYYQLAPDTQWDYYRPRLMITRNFTKLSLMVEDELRIDMTGERETDFYRNRVYVTAIKKMNESLLVGLGYVSQSDKVGGKWISFNGLQTVMKYTIN